MSYYLNQGNKKFISYYNDDIFIDKSLLIKETNNFIGKESKKFMCVTRPRRFGKTMALSMLNAYYSKGCDSKELFKNLKISQDSSFESQLNKHNVIWIDMLSLYTKLEDKSKFIKELNKRIIQDLNEYFPEVLTGDKTDCSDLLYKIYLNKKATFIFLIDEWDVVFRLSSDEKLKNNYIEFLMTLFKSSDTSACIDLVYMTGILPIKRYSGESNIKFFKEFTMLKSKPISEYMGFTNEDVKTLCEKYNMDFNEMKRWYDGYNLNGVEIYNPRSVVEAITEGVCGNYWTETSSLEPVTEYLQFRGKKLYDKLLNLINDKKELVQLTDLNINIKDINNEETALIILIHLGYLAYDGCGFCKIPNYEIKNELLNVLTKFEDSPYYNIIKLSNDGVMGIFDLDTKLLDKALTENHKLLTNNFNKTKEDVLSCVVLFTFLPLLSFCDQQKEVNTITGRADIIYLPRNNSMPPIIIELKVDKDPLIAIQQIKDKEYINALKGYHGKVILLGINYDNKTLEHNTLVEEIEM